MKDTQPGIPVSDLQMGSKRGHTAQVRTSSIYLHPSLTYVIDKDSRRRSIRNPPTIVEWPTYDKPKPSAHRNHHKSTIPHITIITAEPEKRSKKYRDDTYYRDEYRPRSRSRSSSTESHGIDLLKVRPKSYVVWFLS